MVPVFSLWPTKRKLQYVRVRHNMFVSNKLCRRVPLRIRRTLSELVPILFSQTLPDGWRIYTLYCRERPVLAHVISTLKKRGIAVSMNKYDHVPKCGCSFINTFWSSACSCSCLTICSCSTTCSSPTKLGRRVPLRIRRTLSELVPMLVLKPFRTDEGFILYIVASGLYWPTS